jgi:thymidine kinase
MSAEIGSIRLFIGPMFASKSSAMVAEIRKNMIACKKCAIIKYADDNRYSNDTVITHDGATTTATLSLSTSTLRDCDEQIISSNIQVVGVDEGQFFPDIAEYADKWANAGIKVIVAALDGDYMRVPFETIATLIPLAEDVVKLKSICNKCFSDSAAFTHRLTKCDSQVLIGGADLYSPLCRNCYNVA